MFRRKSRSLGASLPNNKSQPSTYRLRHRFQDISLTFPVPDLYKQP